MKWCGNASVCTWLEIRKRFNIRSVEVAPFWRRQYICTTVYSTDNKLNSRESFWEKRASEWVEWVISLLCDLVDITHIPVQCKTRAPSWIDIQYVGTGNIRRLVGKPFDGSFHIPIRSHPPPISGRYILLFLFCCYWLVCVVTNRALVHLCHGRGGWPLNTLMLLCKWRDVYITHWLIDWLTSFNFCTSMLHHIIG